MCPYNNVHGFHWSDGINFSIDKYTKTKRTYDAMWDFNVIKSMKLIQPTYTQRNREN